MTQPVYSPTAPSASQTATHKSTKSSTRTLRSPARGKRVHTLKSVRSSCSTERAVLIQRESWALIRSGGAACVRRTNARRCSVATVERCSGRNVAGQCTLQERYKLNKDQMELGPLSLEVMLFVCAARMIERRNKRSTHLHSSR